MGLSNRRIVGMLDEVATRLDRDPQALHGHGVRLRGRARLVSFLDDQLLRRGRECEEGARHVVVRSVDAPGERVACRPHALGEVIEVFRERSVLEEAFR